MKFPVYFDNHSTTPVDPRVLEAMLPYFQEKFGNAASRNHAYGWDASAGVEKARKQVAALVHASAKEIIFTSGASESDNLAIKGVARACRDRGNHIVTLPTEHKAVLDSCRRLESEGFRVTYLPVQPDGLVNLSQLKDALTRETLLVSIMAANNEIGVLQPMAEIGRLCREKGVLLHTDAAQATGKVPIDVEAMNIDLMSIAGHKMYAPKGIGALYIRQDSPHLRLLPILDGGGQENGLRSGTLNVPFIVALGKACEICTEEMEMESRRLKAMRDRLKDAILSQLEGVCINGSMECRLPNNLNLSFADVDGGALLTGLNDIALSQGSACSSGKPEPSYVLKALGLSDELASSCVRFGLGRFNNEEETDYVIARVVQMVRGLREVSPASELQQEPGPVGKPQ